MQLPAIRYTIFVLVYKILLFAPRQQVLSQFNWDFVTSFSKKL